MTQELVALITQLTREIVEERKEKSSDQVDRNTRLFGREGLLDSVELVSLVVALEQAIEDEFAVGLSLADEKALSQERSPFRTVGDLADYASRLIQEERQNG